MIDYDAHRWRDHFLDVRGSMVREILYRLLSCVLFSIAVTLVDRLVTPLGMSDKAHSLVSVALGLLLVFRTNAAYDRFWEGRKLWGSMVNTSRNLGRLLLVHLGAQPALARRLLLMVSAFPFAVMQRLRDAEGLGPCHSRLAPEDEVATLGREGSLPLSIALRLSTCLKQARDGGLLSDYQLVALEGHVCHLIDQLGGCERIHRTPIPFAYVVHLRRALLLYCFSLPFVLLPHFGWATIPIGLVVSYILLGIEEIGVEISDPFGTDDNDLPLEQIAETIENNLRSLLAEVP